jgi:colanic acid/amylovoran biosynthesis glycosyltransferase
MTIAYVVSRYPAISHTFVLREVLALRAQGVRVHTFSVRAARRAELLTPADQHEASQTINLQPINVPLLIATHARAFFTRPIRYLKTVAGAIRTARPGIRGRIWGVFYFLEAILLFEHCRRLKIRHLHAHFANVSADLARLAKQFGGTGWTWSFTMHGPTEFYDEEKFNLARKVNDADAVMCISDFCRSQLMMLCPPNAWEKLQVVHCGIDPAIFAPTARAVSVDAPVRVLCVGRLVPEKGQSVLLQALAALRAKGRSLHLTLIGGGPEEASIKQMVDQLGLRDFVTLAGPQSADAVRDAYRAADIFCLASFAEGVPVVLMEAMASGLPVVATKIMGIPELVDAGGILVAPGRVDELAAALERLALDPALRERMGEAGRSKVETSFNSVTEAHKLRLIFAAFDATHATPDETQIIAAAPEPVLAEVA